jgi:hypothetical protein
VNFPPGKWPTVEASLTRKVTIWHAQAWAGNTDQHSHDLFISFGWEREINPRFGHTWSVYETEAKVAKLCALVDGKNLNEILPYQPTVETLACWLMVRCAGIFDYVEIAGYEGYRVRVKNSGIPKNFRDVYLNGDVAPAMTV